MLAVAAPQNIVGRPFVIIHSIVAYQRQAWKPRVVDGIVSGVCYLGWKSRADIMGLVTVLWRMSL